MMGMPEMLGMTDMADDGFKITLRMGTDEAQALEDFLGERDIDNKSDFIREAIKWYMEHYDAIDAMAAPEGGIFVRLSEMQMDVLNQLVQRGICLNGEEFIRRCVMEKIVPKTVEEEAYADSFRAAQQNAALK